MHTTFNFSGSIAAESGGPNQGDNTAGTVTGDVDDGVISVGDAVTLSGFNASSKVAGGVGDDTAFYLGNGTFGGKAGYVFGDTNTIAANTKFFVVFDVILTGAEASDVQTFANDKPPLGSDPACFAAGTMIATPTGEVRVEHLKIGDSVLTEQGKSVVVKWMGRQTLLKLFAGHKMEPVRLRAGALGNGLPHSDLTVTADHGMIVDCLVINASALVNGDTIDFVQRSDLPDTFTVYHVETEAHDIILANGAASETFLDTAGRAMFDNRAEYLDLYGTERIIPEMDRPRISAQRLLPDTIRARLGIAPFQVLAYADNLTDVA